MLVTFRSEVYSNVTMFGNVADRLLKLMGHSGTVPGVILAKDISQVLQRLQASVEHEKRPEILGDGDEDEIPVSLAHRALPLIELLKASEKENCDVMWDKS